MLEYYEVEEEGVDVPMMVEQEPYLLKGLKNEHRYMKIGIGSK
jgi:hypothetical protein